MIDTTTFTDRIIVVRITPQDWESGDETGAIGAISATGYNELPKDRGACMATGSPKFLIEPVSWSSGKTVTWSATPVGTEKGSLPAGVTRLARRAGFNFTAANNQSIINANGTVRAKLHAPPHGWNEYTVTVTLDDMPYCDSSIKAIVPAAVVIDPGHWKRIKTAGYDPGAVNGAIHEAERVWVISNRTKTTLDASAGGKPLTVRLTHDGTNGQMTLRQRAAVARPLLADVYLSVHLNAAGTNTVRGVETFYDSTGNTNTAQDTALGTLINNAVVALTGQNNRGVKGKGLGTLDDVAMGNTNACSITRSCLVEVGFLSNNTFAAWINTAANANSVGDTLATAILSSLNTQP
jgi:N-acetylmuramoyl-L-alanine amidase